MLATEEVGAVDFDWRQTLTNQLTNQAMPPKLPREEVELTLASRLDSGDGAKFVINQLVGRAIEAIMLSQLDPNVSYDFLGGKTPKDSLAELKQQKELITALSQNFRDALPTMTESELLSYTERQRISGELEAMRWLQQRRNATGGPERPP